MTSGQNNGIPTLVSGVICLLAREAGWFGVIGIIASRSALENNDLFLANIQGAWWENSICLRYRCRCARAAVSAIRHWSVHSQVWEDCYRCSTNRYCGIGFGRAVSRRPRQRSCPVRVKILIGTNEQGSVCIPFTLVGVTLRWARAWNNRIACCVVKILDEDRVRGVSDIEIHPARVPIRYHQVPCSVRLLNHIVVMSEGELPVGMAYRTRPFGKSRLREQYRVRGIGDLDQINIEILLVVDHCHIGFIARVPCNRAVRFVGAAPVEVEVTKAIHDQLYIGWVRNVP